MKKCVLFCAFICWLKIESKKYFFLVTISSKLLYTTNNVHTLTEFKFELLNNIDFWFASVISQSSASGYYCYPILVSNVSKSAQHFIQRVMQLRDNLTLLPLCSFVCLIISYTSYLDSCNYTMYIHL